MEMAGAIADMAREALPRDFRNVDPCKSRVLLVEAGPRVLAAFPENLSAYAHRALERHGVEVQTGTPVTHIGPSHVAIGDRTVKTGAVIWAAGVAASAAADWISADRDGAGRVKVGPDLSIPGHSEIFVIGDTAVVVDVDGKPVPGIAPAAKQMGRYVASVIAARAAGKLAPPPFHYRHAGDLATIGRRAAVVKLRYMTVRGFLGWVFWGLAHIYFLIGMRNRIAVAFSWAWDYVTFGRRARLITEPADARPAEALASGPSVPPSATEPTSGAGVTTSERQRGWR